MKQSLYVLSFLLLLLVAFWGGARYHQRTSVPETGDSRNRQILHYVDPMNPEHITQEPGIAPCGMPMEPVYADNDTVSGSGAGLSASPGQVRVNLQKQQTIGVQTGEVTKSAETYTIRALGRVTANENRIYTLIAATDGWMGEVHGSTTGSLVDKNQLMAHIKILDYDFFTWQRRYLTELSSVGRKRSFYTPTSGADQMLEEIPAGRQAGPLHTDTDTSEAMPQASTPQETAADQTPPETRAPDHTSAPSTAPTPSRPAARSPMETPHSSHGTGEMPASTMPDAMPQAEEAQTAPPHHSDKAPVLLRKRAMLPEAARRGQERIVVRESDGGLGFADEEDSFSASRARLELLNRGVGENQLAELSKSRVYITAAELRSPVRGLILSRNISPRQKIERGAECFRIADLSRVWVEVDVYDIEAKSIQPGMKARVSLPRQRAHWAATVSEVLPRFDAVSRSLRVRLEMDNPELAFRPDMFVDVQFSIPLPESITVPVSAVIDSGKRQTVYVVIGEGVFEPRAVMTGWRSSDRVEIVSGLQPGDKIVIAGNFLIDSESRMKLAAVRLMEDKAEQPALPQAPAAAAASEPQIAQPAVKNDMPKEKTKDPVCGMTVNEENAIADGLTVEHEGKTFYFCSEDCKEQFKQNPRSFLGEKAADPAPTDAPAHGGHSHD